MIERFRKLDLSGLRPYRDTIAMRAAAAISNKVLRAFWNQGYWDFDHNGERRVISTFAKSANESPVIFDVGANVGIWSKLIAAQCPTASIYAFEPIPDLCKQLVRSVADFQNVKPQPFGLSNTDGQIEIVWNKSFPETNSINPTYDSHFFNDADLAKITCRLRTGDDVVSELEIPRVDFLKIDTEGHEVSVLEGFKKTFSTSRAPRVIQFEYGYTYLASHRTLKDVYEILSPFGYTIGRVFPNRVAFKQYEVFDDHFRMGNYIAVKADDALHALLS